MSSPLLQIAEGLLHQGSLHAGRTARLGSWTRWRNGNLRHLLHHLPQISDILHQEWMHKNSHPGRVKKAWRAHWPGHQTWKPLQWRVSQGLVWCHLGRLSHCTCRPAITTNVRYASYITYKFERGLRWIYLSGVSHLKAIQRASALHIDAVTEDTLNNKEALMNPWHPLE